jgi:predicted SprT family Zn-dependent metalloprotease
MDEPSDLRESGFRQAVFAAHAELYPLASALLDELLRRFKRARARAPRPAPLARGIEIRNIGRLAGQCTREGTLVINSQLIDHPGEIRATVAHELAHAVVEAARRNLLAGNGRPRLSGPARDMARRSGEWSAHGAIWRQIIGRLGEGGERCHRLPLQPVRRLRRFLYRADCGAEVQLTSIRHNRLQRNRHLSYRWGTNGVVLAGRHFLREIDPAP